MPWRNFMNSKLNWLIVPFAVNSYCAINDKKLKCARSHFPHNNPSVISKNPLHSKKRTLSGAFWVTNTHFSDFYRKDAKHCVNCSMVGNNNKDSSFWLYWKENKISYHSKKRSNWWLINQSRKAQSSQAIPSIDQRKLNDWMNRLPWFTWLTTILTSETLLTQLTV